MKNVIFYLSSINRLFVDLTAKRKKTSIQSSLTDVIEFSIHRKLVFKKDTPDRNKTQIRIEETLLCEFDKLCEESAMSRTEYINHALAEYQIRQREK